MAVYEGMSPETGRTWQREWRKWPVALVLGIAVVAVYLLALGGVFHSIDEELYLRITGSLAENGSFSVVPIEYGPEFSVARGIDGQFYANRGPGLPIVAVPFYLLGRAMSPEAVQPDLLLGSGIEHPTTLTLFLTLMNTLVVTATVVLSFLTLRRLGFGLRPSTAVALILAFGTMMWPYASKSFFAEPLLGLCTLGAFYCALRYRQGGTAWLLVVAGALLGWGVLTKVTAFALVPMLSAYILWPHSGWELPFSKKNRWTALVWIGVGLAPFVLFWMLHNFQRFGNPLVTGYELEHGSTPLTVEDPIQYLLGLYGLTLSFGKGLAVYATPVLLGIWAAPRFWRTHRAEALFIFGTAIVTVAGAALWRDWSGGWCWGPRLVMNVVPLLLIPAASLLSSFGELSRGERSRIVWIVAGSVAVQIVGVLPNYLEWYLVVADYRLVYFSPLHSPILGHTLAVTMGSIDLFWNKIDLFFPGQAPLFATLRWLLVGIALVAGSTLRQMLALQSPVSATDDASEAVAWTPR